MSNHPLILLVDDDPNFREIFSVKLKAAGFRVETAEDGHAAVEKCLELKPDLVLMDVAMPKMNGAQALLKIKDNPKCHNLKIAFLTAMGDPRSDVQEIHRRFSKEVGAVGYFKKEENLEELVSYIKRFIQ